MEEERNPSGEKITSGTQSEFEGKMMAFMMWLAGAQNVMDSDDCQRIKCDAVICMYALTGRYLFTVSCLFKSDKWWDGMISYHQPPIHQLSKTYGVSTKRIRNVCENMEKNL